MRSGFLLFSAEPLEERFNLYELKRTHPSRNPFELWLGWCEAIMSREKEKDAMIGWRAGERTKDGTVDMTAQNIAWGSTTRNSLITTRFNQMFVFKEERMWDRNKAPCHRWSIQIERNSSSMYNPQEPQPNSSYLCECNRKKENLWQIIVFLNWTSTATRLTNLPAG